MGIGIGEVDWQEGQMAIWPRENLGGEGTRANWMEEILVDVRGEAWGWKWTRVGVVVKFVGRR